MNLRIFTDGGARGNPGPAGIGVSICDLDAKGKEIETISEFIGDATNNQAEYLAALEGLRVAQKLGAKTVEVMMDSELVVKQMKREYKVKNVELAKLFLQVTNLCHAFERVTFRHIPRAQNARADELVNKAIDAAT